METGEFKIGGIANIEDLKPAYIIAYSGDSYNSGTEANPNIVPVSQNGYSYNGIFSSITYIVTNEYGFDVIMSLLQLNDNSSKIVTVFTVPQIAVKSLIPVDPPRNT